MYIDGKDLRSIIIKISYNYWRKVVKTLNVEYYYCKLEESTKCQEKAGINYQQMIYDAIATELMDRQEYEKKTSLSKVKIERRTTGGWPNCSLTAAIACC